MRQIGDLLLNVCERLVSSPARVFVVLATLFGLIHCFATPPFIVLDESVHFTHAYQVSKGVFRAEKLEGEYYGGEHPKILDENIKKALEFRFKQPKLQTKYSDNFKHYEKPGDERAKNVNAIYNSTAVYPPVAYAPQAVGIAVGRAFGFSTIQLLIIGRIANLLAWVLLIALAIRFLPFGKWALVVVGLMPTAIFQAASQSADAVTMGLACLSVAWVLRLAVQKNKLSTNQLLITGGLLLLLSLTKLSYVSFCVLVLAWPARLLGKPWSYAKKTGLIVAACTVVAGAWALSVRDVNIFWPVFPEHPPVDPLAQIKFLCTHPLGYLHAIWTTYLGPRGDLLGTSFVSQYGVLYDLHLPMFATIGAYTLLGLAYLSEEKHGVEKHLAQRIRLVSGVTWLLSVALLTTVLYLTYTTIANTYVDGMQARYLMPLMVLLIPVAKLRKAKLLRLSVAPILLMAGSVALLTMSTVMLVFRAYTGF